MDKIITRFRPSKSQKAIGTQAHAASHPTQGGESSSRSRSSVLSASSVVSNPPHPSATSSVIITAKPIIAPIVAMSWLPLDCDSGTTSSTTTKIMAPAAKASA